MTADVTADVTAANRPPRLGFAGLGWIGRQRLEVLAASGLAEVAALCEPDPARLAGMLEALGTNPVCTDFPSMLELRPDGRPLDGVVIATPNCLHEEQALAALEHGLAVFCQKPVAVGAAGTARVLSQAARRGLPLGVDYAYRHLAGMDELRERIRGGDLGRVHVAELWFHNAWGPDAGWYYDIAQAGGGCLLDLGCHLLDLCHWLLGVTEPVGVQGRCFRAGKPLPLPVREPEDFVLAGIDYAEGLHVRLGCSWRAPAGCGALIGMRLFGSDGGASLRNLDGSFYDFEVAVHHGTDTEILATAPDDWPGRALVRWAKRLHGPPCIAEDAALLTTARTIDRIYGRSGTEGHELPARRQSA